MTINVENERGIAFDQKEIKKSQYQPDWRGVMKHKEIKYEITIMEHQLTIENNSDMEDNEIVINNTNIDPTIYYKIKLIPEEEDAFANDNGDDFETEDNGEEYKIARNTGILFFNPVRKHERAPILIGNVNFSGEVLDVIGYHNQSKKNNKIFFSFIIQAPQIDNEQEKEQKYIQQQINSLKEKYKNGNDNHEEYTPTEMTPEEEFKQEQEIEELERIKSERLKEDPYHGMDLLESLNIQHEKENIISQEENQLQNNDDNSTSINESELINASQLTDLYIEEHDNISNEEIVDNENSIEHSKPLSKPLSLSDLISTLDEREFEPIEPVSLETMKIEAQLKIEDPTVFMSLDKPIINLQEINDGILLESAQTEKKIIETDSNIDAIDELTKMMEQWKL